MLWVKAFHVLAIIGWLTGVFYTPRVLVNYAEAEKIGEPLGRLRDMAKRLYRFSTILGLIGVALGAILWLWYDITGTWLHIKLYLVLALVVYHILCGLLIHRIQHHPIGFSPTAMRVINEVPVLVVGAILVLVIVKPF